MKKQLLSFVGMLGLLMVAESAFAQHVHVRANIPFNFTINKNTLPAGQYDVREIDSAGGHVLAIQSGEGKMGQMFLTNAVSASASPNKTKLVFTRYGDQYFLSQIWLEGSDIGRELPKSAREAELARASATKKVVVAAALQ